MTWTLAILSWKCHRTLTNTLRSYRDFGLLDLADQRLIFFQEIADADREIAHRFGLQAFGSATNIGCGPGMLELARASRSQAILLLENDWVLLEDLRRNSSAFDIGMHALLESQADAVRLRHRARPGRPFWAGRNVRGHEQDWPSHLLWSVCWLSDPSARFPDHIERIASSPDLFRAPSQYADFTFNPCLYRTKFLRRVLGNIDFQGAHPLRHEALVQQWWCQQDIQVAQGEGLFEHRELDTPYWNRLRSIPGLGRLRARSEGIDTLCERIEKLASH